MHEALRALWAETKGLGDHPDFRKLIVDEAIIFRRRIADLLVEIDGATLCEFDRLRTDSAAIATDIQSRARAAVIMKSRADQKTVDRTLTLRPGDFVWHAAEPYVVLRINKAKKIGTFAATRYDGYVSRGLKASSAMRMRNDADDAGMAEWNRMVDIYIAIGDRAQAALKDAASVRAWLEGAIQEEKLAKIFSTYVQRLHDTCGVAALDACKQILDGALAVIDHEQSIQGVLGDIGTLELLVQKEKPIEELVQKALEKPLFVKAKSLIEASYENIFRERKRQTA